MTILILMFTLILLLLGTTNSKAILQANPTTHKNPAKGTGTQCITETRKMETANQTMGLNETLNGLNATSASNGIDVHMMLPTEYGAVAILSASGYGNPKKLRDETDAQKRTTTGNSTGVYFTGDRWEMLASLSTGNTPYYNMGRDEKGTTDFLMGAKGWHEGNYGTAVNPNTGGQNGTFSYAFHYSNGAFSLCGTGGCGLFTVGWEVDSTMYLNYRWNANQYIMHARGCAT